MGSRQHSQVQRATGNQGVGIPQSLEKGTGKRRYVQPEMRSIKWMLCPSAFQPAEAAEAATHGEGSFHSPLVIS